MENLILRRIERQKNVIKFHFEVTSGLALYFTSNELFLSYPQDMSAVPDSILTIPFVASILPLVWLTNSVMWVEKLDRTFYDAIARIKSAYQELYPHVRLRGRFVAASTEENTFKPEQEALLLFGGGVDAHTTFLRHIKKQPALCNIQGWYQDLKDKNSAADADFRDIGVLAEKHGCASFFVKSNFARLIDNQVFHDRLQRDFKDSWWHGFQHSMSFISIAIPLAYQNKYRNVYIGSSFTIGDEAVCASYPTTDIEFRFADRGGCVHDAFELSRQDKIRVLVEYQRKTQEKYPIRVCSFNSENCCRCDKCFRTILGLVAEGANPANFGFIIEKGLKEHFEELMEQQLHLLGVEKESVRHWPYIRERMRENYENVFDREFTDWFLSYDFIGERKKAIIRYYKRDFFKILKRKLKL